MFAYLKSDRKRRRIRTVAYSLLLMTLLLAFLSTADGPVASFGFNVVSIVNSKAARFLGWEHGAQLVLALIGLLNDAPPVVHASFLLFDYKQNLRVWPVLAGDISRSPPFIHAL